MSLSLADRQKIVEDNLIIYHSQQGKSYSNSLKDYFEENGYDEDAWNPFESFLKNEYNAKNEFDEEIFETHDFVQDWIDDDDNQCFEWIQDDRYRQIFNILKNCFDDHYRKQSEEEEEEEEEQETKQEEEKQIIRHIAIGLDNNDWEITEKDIEETIKLYQEQCKKLCNKEMIADGNMMRILTIGSKQQIPFLQWIVDLYARDRIIRNKPLSINEWATTNPYCIQLRKIRDDKAIEILTSSISSFGHRIAPKMMINEISNQIDDNLSEVADYISAAIKLAGWLIGENKQTHLKQESVPFQMDFSFIFSNTIKCNNNNNNDHDDDDDDDQSDDDDDKDEGDELFDHFGAIEPKLDTINSISQDRDKGEENKEDQLLSTTELLKNHFYLFRREVKKEQETNGYKSYPKDHRFVVLIDRRKPNKDGHGASYLRVNDDIHMFEAPNANQLPKNPTALALFDLSARVLIPGKDISGDDIEYIVKTQMAPKSAFEPCQGSLMTLSIHCFSEDQVRAYLFINGSSVRFFNDDIINILPKYFSDSEENKKFINSDHAKKLIESTNGILKDTKFEQFYNLFKMQPTTKEV